MELIYREEFYEIIGKCTEAKIAPSSVLGRFCHLGQDHFGNKMLYVAQTINYLKVSVNRLGLLINFGRGKLEHKRLIL
jgi:hypothetical protein